MPEASARGSRIAHAIVSALACLAFLLLVHNYGISLLPDKVFRIPPTAIKPLPGEKSFAYFWEFDAARGADELNPQSRARFAEDAHVYTHVLRNDAEVRLVGGGRWTHERTRVVFATTDNTDPVTNGRTYSLRAPILYTPAVGRTAAMLFALSVFGLYRLNRRAPPQPESPAGSAPVPALFRWRWPCIAAGVVFLLGLYCNTGTLAPYGNTSFPHVDKATGYLYNTDHVHFRVLFDFVDGAERKIWDRALLLRRILFPVLAWPFMKLAGFEVGGTIASLVFHAIAFVVSLNFIGRRFGGRAASLAAWLIALYPGAAYWGGLPYSYALIFPASLLLTLGIISLADAPLKKVLWLSPLMGVAYLGYDLHPFFIPATLLALAWHRRFGAALASVLLQIVPFVIWVTILVYGLKQPLENGNSAAYRVILTAFFKIKEVGAWWATVSNFDEIGLDVFFGSNFIFLPALFLAVVALNAVTSRISFQPVELALILVATGLFVFSNLAPFYGGAWNLRGTWIARLYQPVFPVFILFIARWWQHLPPLSWPLRSAIWLLGLAALAGNALIVFGPILKNPLKVSEFAYYRFYNHNDVHWIYERYLNEYGRRPIGFPRPQK